MENETVPNPDKKTCVTCGAIKELVTAKNGLKYWRRTNKGLIGCSHVWQTGIVEPQPALLLPLTANTTVSV